MRFIFNKLVRLKTKKSLSSDHFFEIKDHIMPGDVVFTRTPFKMYNILIPGYWTHCALYLGGDRLQVIDANGNGVEIRSLIDFWTYTSDIAVARPLCHEHDVDKAIEFALSKEYAPYDYYFSSDVDSFYCSELIFNSYRKFLKMRKHLFLKSITPTDLYKDDFFKVTYSSKY